MRSKKKLFLGCFFVMLCAMLMGMPVSAASAKLNKTKATVVVGKTVKLKVKNTSQKVTWSSSKKSVATVNSKGLVKAKNAGKTTITAKVGSKSLKCKVTVKSNVWKNGQALSSLTAWTGLPTVNKSFMYFIYAQPYKVKYNANGELVAWIAVQNDTMGTNYKLSKMSVTLRKNNANGAVLAKGTFSKSKTISPVSYPNKAYTLVKVTFKGSKTKKIINLRNLKTLYSEIQTN